jgi:hypothetical protein
MLATLDNGEIASFVGWLAGWLAVAGLLPAVCWMVFMSVLDVCGQGGEGKRGEGGGAD